jgi:hypothetical protein
MEPHPGAKTTRRENQGLETDPEKRAAQPRILIMLEQPGLKRSYPF